MRYVILLLAVALPGLVWGQHQHTSPTAVAAVLMPGLGPVHHAVSTNNPEAQRFFDQGLSLIFAFNHDEAVLAFQRAADLDPRLAMAYWGMALALGSNYNLPPDPERQKAAYEALQKAQSLAARAPEQERAYITALSRRYSSDPQADLGKLAVEYKQAMGELSQRYPDDLDAATLYAESAMNLHPWQLWNRDGTPAEGTEGILAVLESVLKRNPDHLGANHYYIHAIEASHHPERALASAARLESLAPAAGHLVHMPAHIYMRVGDYDAAAHRNAVAASVDEAYIKSRGVQGIYPLMYYSHNLHFLAVARAMQGRSREAATAAEKLAAHVTPHIKTMPTLEFFVPTSLLLRVRFRQWDAIWQSPPPAAEMALTRAMWHFARGMASAATGQTEQAETEWQAFLAARQAVPADATWDLNSASDVLDIAQHVLQGRMAMAKSDRKAAVEVLRKAVELEDSLNYAEPSGWYLPVREMLGGMLLVSGEYGEAESVFRADLANNPRSGRSLFGLQLSLKGQGQSYAAQLVQQELQTAWENADTPLRLEDL
jgi:tetratricopeptide (TPR) repeat protein